MDAKIVSWGHTPFGALDQIFEELIKAAAVERRSKWPISTPRRLTASSWAISTAVWSLTHLLHRWFWDRMTAYASPPQSELRTPARLAPPLSIPSAMRSGRDQRETFWSSVRKR